MGKVVVVVLGMLLLFWMVGSCSEDETDDSPGGGYTTGVTYSEDECLVLRFIMLDDSESASRQSSAAADYASYC